MPVLSRIAVHFMLLHTATWRAVCLRRESAAPQAEQARRTGGAFQLKRFHNDIKRALINR